MGKTAYTKNFEEFWGKYPRKKNTSKFKAFQSFKKQTAENISEADLVEACECFRILMLGREERSIPHATTWLNQKRWESLKEWRGGNYPADFENFWTAYPRKDGSRMKAYRHFQSAVKEIGLEKLIEHTDRYARSVMGEDEEFVPFPSKWLAEKMWETL